MAQHWGPARLRLRAELRTRRAALVLLVIVIAVASGLALAAAAGARRSNTAYDRFRVWSREPELTLGGCDCSADQLAAAFASLRSAPFVQDSVTVGFANLAVGFGDGRHTSSIAFLSAIDLEGRLARVL